MFGNTIKRRVLLVINKKIELAEKSYTSGCKEIDVLAEKKKTELADELVETLVGKFL